MSNYPLMDVLFTALRQRVLALLLLRPDEAIHLRELARLSGAHAGTLMRELAKLADAGLLLRSTQGNQVRFQANAQHPLFADLASMFRKSHGAVVTLQAALDPLLPSIGLAFVFGSVARGEATDRSDIDLLVLGEVGFAELVQAIHPLLGLLGREVNPVLYRPEEFARRISRQDAFAIDLMAKPRLWVKGSEHDLAELAGHPEVANPSG